MGEYERVDTISSRGPRRVGDRRVVVEHIGEPGQPDLFDQIAAHDGMYQHVGPGAEFVEPHTWHRVPGDHHRPLSLVDAEADGRPNRRMVGRGSCDPYRAFFEDCAPVDLDDRCRRSPPQVVVVGEAVADVRLEHRLGGLQESCCALRTEHGKRIGYEAT